MSAPSRPFIAKSLTTGCDLKTYRSRLHRVLLYGVARDTANLAVFDGSLSTLRPRLDVIGCPIVPLAFISFTLQCDLADAPISPIDRQPLLMHEKPLVVFQLDRKSTRL